MPTIVKHVFKFQSEDGWGWTETHFSNPATTGLNINTVLDYNETGFIVPRVALLGKNYYSVGQRVSYRTPNGIASQSRDKIVRPLTDYDGADSTTSLATVMINNDGTKKKIIHLRGFWDDLVRNDIIDPSPAVAADWNPRFFNYLEALKALPYGWLTKDTTNSPTGQVTNYTSSDDDIVTFTVTGSAQLTALIGTIQNVKFSKINGSNSTLNRNIVCFVENGTTLVTVAPIAATSFTGKGKFSIRLLTFVGYAGSGSVTVGERRMGRPLGKRAGRSKARARI